MGVRPLALALAFALAPQAVTAKALPGVPERKSLFGTVYAGGGTAVPFGGHWGDAEAGFKPAPAFTLAASRPLSELVSAGLEFSRNYGHDFRGDHLRTINLLSAGPFVRSAVSGTKFSYYGVFGTGLYYWDQPSFRSGGTYYPSGSGSAFGFSLGAGFERFLGPVSAGFELRWHHIFDMKSRGLDLNSADNLNLMALVSLPVWK